MNPRPSPWTTYLCESASGDGTGGGTDSAGRGSCPLPPPLPGNQVLVCTALQAVHYFARRGVKDLSREDSSASFTPTLTNLCGTGTRHDMQTRSGKKRKHSEARQCLEPFLDCPRSLCELRDRNCNRRPSSKARPNMCSGQLQRRLSPLALRRQHAKQACLHRP